MKTPSAPNKINYTLYSESGSRMSTLIIRPDCILFLRVESRAGGTSTRRQQPIAKRSAFHYSLHACSLSIGGESRSSEQYMPEHGEGVPL